MEETANTENDQIYRYEIYQKIVDYWFTILQSDISVFGYFDKIHPADLLFSWTKGYHSSINGRMKDEFLRKEDIKGSAARLTHYLYMFLIERVDKAEFYRLFKPTNNLTQNSLFLSLLFERQKL